MSRRQAAQLPGGTEPEAQSGPSADQPKGARMSRRQAAQLPGGTEPEAQPGPSADQPDAQADQPQGLCAADVDPTKIRRAVLTLNGWVCPDRVPAPPAKE